MDQRNDVAQALEPLDTGYDQQTGLYQGKNRMRDENSLVLMAALLAKSYPDQGKVRVTAKFLDGMNAYVKVWPGAIKVLMRPDVADSSGNLDDVLVDPSELPFRLIVSDFSKRTITPLLGGSSVVQGGSSAPELNYLPDLCRQMGIAHVFVAECTLKTRLQILAAETRNPILRLRRGLWQSKQEISNRRGVRLSAALQCNGTPTFDAYSPLNENALLFFDSRTSEDMIPKKPKLHESIQRLREGKHIRLAFSGRLNRIKGVDDLIIIAEKLQRLRVPFSSTFAAMASLNPSCAV